MVKQDISPATPAPGTSKDEGIESGRQAADSAEAGLTARDATSINPKDRGPIDPQMPDLPPA